MILVLHDFTKVVAVSCQNQAISFEEKHTIGYVVYLLAQQFPDKIIVWSHVDVIEAVDIEYCEQVLVVDRIMCSYNPFNNYMSDVIGYVEQSPFININKKVKYPTWQMSSLVGGIHTNSITQTLKHLWTEADFDYCLTSVAKVYQPLGLFCYSDPKLLCKDISLIPLQVSKIRLFKFVKQYYKTIWVYLLLFNVVFYDQKIPLYAFFKSFFIKKLLKNNIPLLFGHKDSQLDLSNETIDVIVPTIGRKKELYDVLCDLKVQTHLPVQVIIVEQNPLPNSESELNFIQNEKWPFEIKHIFIHQSGACNARNLALKEVKSKWVFLNDDDNRFDLNLIKKALHFLNTYNLKCVSTAYPQVNEVVKNKVISQTTIFGSGNTFLESSSLNNLQFNLALEFGYGEDTDFGLQLRNKGVDVIYSPNLEITHLKAPMGGFRTKVVHPWESEIVQPKPSPTIMYVKNKFNSPQQVLGYKMMLFFKMYSYQFWKWNLFQKSWNCSVKWANKLEEN